MRKWLASEAFIFITSTLFLILLSLIPFFYQAAKTPHDSVFIGIHNFAEDYFIYLSEKKTAKTATS